MVHRSSNRAGLPAVALAVLLALPPSVWSQGDLSTLLARPRSPGAVASLVGHTANPSVIERLAEALRDPNAAVRAAAARVINVSGLTNMRVDLRSALTAEPDLAAATEEAWALSALGGGEESDVVVSAARRLGGRAPGRFALILARTQGPAALSHAALLAEGPPSSERWRAFLSLAVRADADALSRVAAALLRDGRAAAWKALLRMASNDELSPDPGQLIASLQHAQPGVRAATCWYLAGLRAEGRPIPDAVAAAAKTSLDLPADPALAPFEAFGREILSRAFGRAATGEGPWMASLRDPKIRNRDWPFPNGQVLAYLTRDELKAAGLTSKDVPRPRDRKPASAAEPMRRSPRGYPAGFVTDVLAVTGCEAAPHLPPAMAEVDYGHDGRPRHISLIESLLPRNCSAAGRILLLTALPSLETPSRPGIPEALILPFQPGLMACLGTGEQEPKGQVPTDPKVPLEEPKILHREELTYPRSARRAGSEGIVEIDASVTSSGCVDGFRIVKGKDPKLYWEVVIAKLEDKYSPLVVDGVAVPTLFSHRVNFTY